MRRILAAIVILAPLALTRCDWMIAAEAVAKQRQQYLDAQRCPKWGVDYKTGECRQL